MTLYFYYSLTSTQTPNFEYIKMDPRWLPLLTVSLIFYVRSEYQATVRVRFIGENDIFLENENT